MTAELEDDQADKICAECVTESYLQAVIQESPTGTCTYCKASKVGCMSILDLADRVEIAFRDHFVLTPEDPDELESMRQREFDEFWIREGTPVSDLIQDITGCEEDVAKAVLSILTERHDTYVPGDPYEGECEFAPGSHYDESTTDIKDWNVRWNRLEYKLKHESRLINAELLKLLNSAFNGLHEARSYHRGMVLVPAGPDTNIFELYRAREFHSSANLEAALKNPVKELGPPPGQYARANRMNSSGISVFYGAKERRSALAEVRPVVGSNVVVSKFTIVRPLHLLDLTTLESVGCDGSYFDPDFRQKAEQLGFLRTLTKRLTLPVMPGEQEHAYLITQAVADFLASMSEPSVDGIVFPSVQDGVGENVVLFHKASLVHELEVPPNSLIESSVSDYDYESGEPYPSYTIEIHSPDTAMPQQSEGFVSYRQPEIPTRVPTLRLDMESIEVHYIKAVEVVAEPHKVYVDFTTQNPPNAASQKTEF